MDRQVFLSAEWRSLLMLNYEVDPNVLRPLLPVGTELDLWQGRTLMSMVGFLFLRTRLFGCAVPFHQDFPEVNLRFYVRRKTVEGWRRGVVFVREFVPRRAIAAVAQLLYGERYLRLPMRHTVAWDGESEGRAEYEWFANQRWHRMSASFSGEPQPMADSSEAEFIFEHYWGYAQRRGGGTTEYEVRHPRWLAWTAANPVLDCEAELLYGPAFAEALHARPVSAFVAEGSPIEVLWGSMLPPLARE